MKRKLLLTLLTLLPILASADDAKINGIYYNFTSESEAEVTYGDDYYSGKVAIPQTITYNLKTYRVTSIGESAFSDCSGLTSVTIPNSVTSIGSDAFWNCSGLTSVTIPNSVTSIGNYAFSGCSGLTSVTIPNSVTSIGYSAFRGCSGLTSVTIPNSVTSIGRYAFRGCSGLTSVTIPSSVTSIGYCAFSDCSGLTSIKVETGNTKYDSRNNCNAIIETATNTLIAGCQNTIIPNSVTSIGESAFEYCSGLTSVTIPNSVTSIGNYAFEYCSSLTSITIPNSVTSIGRSAFEYCSGLTSVTIPSSVTSIGNHAFEFCSCLTSIYCFATTPPSISVYSFFNVSAILYVPESSIEAYKSAESWSAFQNIFSIEGNLPGDDMTMEEAAAYLQEKGVVDSGDPKLTEDLLRRQLAKVSFRGVYSIKDRIVPESVPSDNYPTVYGDLTDHTTYYYQAARAMLYLEYGDGVSPFDRNRLEFEPEKTIARIHVLKVLMETFNIQPDMSSTANPFPKDTRVAELAAINPRMVGYIRRAADLGIIKKPKNGQNEEFHPYAFCTRGQAFLMLARIMKKVDAGIINDPNPGTADYFEPLNVTLATISLGMGLQLGNFSHYTKTSFNMSGTVPLTFEHAYNSYNTTLPEVFYGVNDNGETYQPLGDGWSHNYHTYISIPSGFEGSNTRLAVHWGGGNIDVYKPGGSSFVPVSYGVYDEMTFVGGEFVIKTKSQMEYHFASLGSFSEGGVIFYLVSAKDRNGNTLTINYQNGQNGGKRISSVSDGQRSLNFSYDIIGTNLLTSVSDSLGRSITYGYKLNNNTGRYQLSSFKDAKGQTTNYEYGDSSKISTSKLLTRIQLPKGNYINNQYDANRRLTKTENGTSKTTVKVNTSYDSYGATASTTSQVTVTRNGSGTSTYDYAYNGNNVMTSMSGPKGLSMSSTYYTGATDCYLPKSITTNDTEISNIIYDDKGNVEQIDVTGDGQTLTTTMTYDTMNNLTSVTDPMRNKTTYNYDSKGNLIETVSPITSIKTKISVNDKGQPTSVTNPMNVETKYEYNKYGNLTKTTLPALGLSSSADYDLVSRLISSTDALGRTTSFTYDNNDNLISEKDPDNHSTGYDYDANDNLTDITNAKGGVTSMSYDNVTDWLTSVSFAGASRQYDYNQDGTLKTFTKPDGTTLGYSYDDLGRVVDDGVNTYTYDSQTLNLKSVKDKTSGKTLTYTYDGFNRITGTTCDGHSNTYSYDKNGNCLGINGTTYAYDELNRLTSVKFNGKTITYSYRKDSQLSKVEYPNGMTTEYGYDEIGRLTSKKTKLSNGKVIASYTYTLDKVGNITSQTTQEPYDDIVLTNEDVSYSYDNGNRITQAGDIAFSFDKNGNTTKRGDESYSWDVSDRLTKAGSTSITYDPLGLITSYGNITFTTDPLGIGNVLSDSKGAEYIYGNGLEARVKNGKMSYYVTDFRGSVVAIVDENGNVTHKYQYDEFGKVTQKEEADYNPFQYVGKYGVMALNDHLYYMRARHYDPTIGRFLSEDPIWSTNLYPYADNNPIMGIDPEGNAKIKVRYLKGYKLVGIPFKSKFFRAVGIKKLIPLHYQIFFDKKEGYVIPGVNNGEPIHSIGYEDEKDYGTNTLIEKDEGYFDTDLWIPDQEAYEIIKANLPDNFGPYHLIGHNCQNYVWMIYNKAWLLYRSKKLPITYGPGSVAPLSQETIINN